MEETLYEILGIDKEATAVQIKKAYRDMSKKSHPDKVDEDGASSRQAQINEAYDVLSDPAKRKRYDETGQSKDVALDQKIQSFLSQTFLSVVHESKNLEKENIIELTKVGIQGMIRQSEASMMENQGSMRKVQKVIKRLKTKGNKALIVLLDRQVEGIKQDIAAQSEHRDFMKNIILPILNDYEYEVESNEDRWLGFLTNGRHGSL